MPKYDALAIEKKWQDKWIADGTYKFNIDDKGEVYAIDNPPSFTSGTLHMGHALNHVWIDFIARYKRMRGYNVLLPLGYDCHGLPTELRVAQKYKISKDNRKVFREKCEQFTTKAIKAMNKQYKRLGYSCDWDEYYETRMPEYKKYVQHSLLEFYKNDRIYRAKHPVLWCTKCATALAKAEVGHIEKPGKLWYLQFPVVGSGRKIQIATTRPELMFSCVGVFVHPNDKKHASLVGKKVFIPYVDREVPIIADDRVDMEFGTGVVYVCTYGDEMDMVWQREYNLPVYMSIDEKGKMTELTGKYKGKTIREAREGVVCDLKADGYLVKVEDHMHNLLAHTERAACKNPIELIPMNQWFLKIQDLLHSVTSAADTMKWYPEYMQGRLKDWTEFLAWDWIISRQRVYGTPIPFWYCNACGKIFAPKKDRLPIDSMVDKPPKAKCECGGKIVGTPDICDCWIDSSVTPLKVSKWLEDEKYFKKAYPNYLRPQGYEIIRTWAFYTILRCAFLAGKPPFKHVVVNGMVAGPDGKKMSKSFDNIVAPEEVLDKEGCDALRQWALAASLGEDYPFLQKEIVHGMKFQKKYWNACFFASKHIANVKMPANIRFADKWILHRLNSVIQQATEQLDNYEFAKVLKLVRTFFWHDVCDSYLEMVKHRLYNATGQEKQAAQFTMKEIILKTSLLLAPFIPHITEEVHELYLKKTTKSKSIHTMEWPQANTRFISENLECLGDSVIEAIGAIRKFKTEHNMPLNKEVARVVLPKGLEPAAQDIKETVKALEVEFGETVSVHME